MGAGGVARVFTPPPGQKVNVTGIPNPESKSKLITYRYRQTPPQGFFPSPRMLGTIFPLNSIISILLFYLKKFRQFYIKNIIYFIQFI